MIPLQECTVAKFNRTEILTKDIKLPKYQVILHKPIVLVDGKTKDYGWVITKIKADYEMEC